MANTAPYEIIAGSCSVFYAPVGSDFPDPNLEDSAVSDGGTWVNVGYTESGVKVQHPQTVIEHKVDQSTGTVKATRSDEGLVIAFDLASLTLESYAIALNQVLSGPDSGAGDKSLSLYRGGFQVENFAVLVRNAHLSPYADKGLQFEIPVAFESGSPDATFSKENKAVLAVELHAIVNPSRADDSESFGRIRAATP